MKFLEFLVRWSAPVLQNLRIIIHNNVLAAAISFSEARNHTGPISYTRRVKDHTYVFTGQKLLLSLIICEQQRHALCRDLA
jgi:hypothetical protein